MGESCHKKQEDFLVKSKKIKSTNKALIPAYFLYAGVSLKNKDLFVNKKGKSIVKIVFKSWSLKKPTSVFLCDRPNKHDSVYLAGQPLFFHKLHDCK
jgi:hypothetical protein